MVSSTKFCENQ